ncbi:MAG: hypothetical protein PHI35_05265, partial [Victivallaceae bacterium]|nr:hypothetical protein [Victivallaceae bacterium]
MMPVIDAVFGSHMVLQRNKPVALTGGAAPGESLTVEFGNVQTSTVADQHGRWCAVFEPRPAGGPYQIRVESASGEQVELNDVLSGDVWFCSGQSNMNWPLSLCDNSAQEVAQSACERVRLFQEPRRLSPYGPVASAGGKWQKCTPANVRDFSAVAYFFGRQLQNDLQVPIGLVHASLGGAMINTFIPESGFAAAGLPEVDEIATLRQYRDRPADNPRLIAAAKRLGEWVKSFEIKMNQVAVNACRNPGFDDSGWEQASRQTLDAPGSAWFRREVVLDPKLAGSDLRLQLGRVNDCDETFFNGVPVGSTDWSVAGHWFKPRDYNVPGELVHPGRNLIAVHVFNYNREGGLTDLGGEMRLMKSDGDPNDGLNIADNWKGWTEFRFT